MTTIRNRFPSRDEMLYGLAACTLPVFIWSIINMLKEIPAWILRMSTWDLVGAISYTQAFALIESIIVFLLILVLALILPERFFRNKFLTLTAMIVSISTFWFALAHYNVESIRTWKMNQFLMWAVIFGSTLILSYVMVQRFEKMGVAIDTVVKSVSLLSFLYMFIGLMGLIIVVVRNIAWVI